MPDVIFDRKRNEPKMNQTLVLKSIGGAKSCFSQKSTFKIFDLKTRFSIRSIEEYIVSLRSVYAFQWVFLRKIYTTIVIYLRNRLRLLLGQWMAVRPFRLLVRDLVVSPSEVAVDVALQFVLLALSCCSMLLYSVMMSKLNLFLLMDY